VKYDPIEVLYKILVSARDWEADSIELVRVYDLRTFTRTGDYIVIGPSNERQEFLGIGGFEYTRYVTVGVAVYTAESRERAKEMIRMVRDILRNKSNWSYDGAVLLNVILARVSDNTDYERNLWSYRGEVEWFTIEVVET